MERMAHLNGIKENKIAISMIRSVKASKASLNTQAGIFWREMTITLSTWTKRLAALEKQGAVNLIIDTTNNGGGITCSGKSLLSYLFKDSKFVHYDIRLTDTVSYLTNNAARYRNDTNAFDLKVIPVSSKSINVLSTLLSDKSSKTRNGVTDNYSGLFEIDCKGFQYILNVQNLVGPKFLSNGWAPENIAIISNGACGSTCGESVRSLRAQYGIKTYVYGGTTGKPYQPT
ncbi:hypothetical protein HDU97_009118 [Phlyctochytrium planicorne]|nr:hypothetical protein HDU97_009118 [Phlyctochytrium planicorne]